MHNQAINDNGGGGGIPAIPQSQANPGLPNLPANDPLPPALGDTDDYGYAPVSAVPPVPGQPVLVPPGNAPPPVVPNPIQPPPNPAPPVVPQPPAAPPVAPAVEGDVGALGYADEVVQVPPTPPEPPKPDVDLGYELKVEKIPPDELKEFKEVFKAGGLTKEVAQSILDKRAKAIDAAEASRVQRENEIKHQQMVKRNNWRKELREDPTIGGAAFDQSLKMADRVMTDFMPDAKKELTAAGAMLPPSIIRGLVKLGSQLYSSAPLVQGGAPNAAAGAEAEEEDDGTAFYNMKQG